MIAKQFKSIALILMLLFSVSVSAQQDYFEKEIVAFEAQDAANPPIEGQILLYGSSTLRLWSTFETDFANSKYKIVNRGFGGSQTCDANKFFDRVVMPHKPKFIFFYEGDNDIGSGKSVDTVWADFNTFYAKVKNQLPKTQVVYFAIKPSPSRIEQMEKQKAFNGMVKKMANREKRLKYLETFKIMLDKEGKPDPKLFKKDMLHMNAEGYALWTKKVQKLLKRL